MQPEQPTQPTEFDSSMDIQVQDQRNFLVPKVVEVYDMYRNHEISWDEYRMMNDSLKKEVAFVDSFIEP